MKFTIEEVCKELAGRLTTKGEKLNMSERSIREQAERLVALVADDETEMSDFVDKVLPLFKTMDNNVRNDVSGLAKELKETFSKKPSKTKVDTEEEVDGNDFSKLLEKIEGLEKRIAENDKQRKVLDRRASILDKIKDKGVKNTEWVNSLLDEMPLGGDEFDADKSVERIVKLYNGAKAGVDSDITPDIPRGDDKARMTSLQKTIQSAKKLGESRNLIDKN